ncbi:hypothetical protein BH20ACT5_BH20ACT5_03650 [soil metagenome]
MSNRWPVWAVPALACVTAAATVSAPAVSPSSDTDTLSVIVRQAVADSWAAEVAVLGLGGRPGQTLGLIDGFTATLPTSALARLQASPAVLGAWPDGTVTMNDVEDCHEDDDDDDDDDYPDLDCYDALPPSTVWRQAIGLPSLPPTVTGEGVTVAVLDTGLTRNADLGDRVLARVDLTPDGGGYDDYGHGTHMTGIIAGDGTLSGGRWTGVAPDVGIVSVKVADWNGATDVSQILAGLEWVHNNADRYGIRVLNLSFGTNGTQDYLLDPLNFAVERLWNAGVLVVVSAGNRGPGPLTIDKPGDDPFVVTVGAADLNETPRYGDDAVASFSSHGPTGDGIDKPDLVAPGISIVSHRAPGSTLDAMRAAARQDTHYFKGTGSSQATAIVSGTAALMFQVDPLLTPNEAKAALVGTTTTTLAGQPGAGSGLLHAARAVQAAHQGTFASRPANVGLEPSLGTGSLHASRGTHEIWTDLDGDGVAERIIGEIDALGNRFDSARWAARPWNDRTAATSPWAPLTHLSPGWSDTPWTPGAWPGLGWDHNSWTARTWKDAGLTPGNWTARTWKSEPWN